MSKTPKYKKPSALKHGVFAAAAILPGENPKEFHDLLASFIAEWDPEGMTELEFVITMAQAAWAKRRRQKHGEMRVFENTINPKHASFNEDLGLRGLAAFLQMEPETAFETHASRFLRPDKVAEFNLEFPLSNYQSETDRAKAILANINAQLAKRTSLRSLPVDIVGLHSTLATVSMEVFRQEIELDERLNAMLYRAMKALIECKSMKQILRETTSR